MKFRQCAAATETSWAPPRDLRSRALNGVQSEGARDEHRCDTNATTRMRARTPAASNPALLGQLGAGGVGSFHCGQSLGLTKSTPMVEM